MRILICSWRDIGNPRAGGAERVTFEHARRWVAAGHQVTLFTAAYPGAAAEDTLAGIRVVRRGGETTVHLAAQHWYRRQRPRPDLVVDEIHGLPFGAAAYAGVPVVAWIYEVARDIWFRMYPLPLAAAGWTLEAAALRRYARTGVPFVADSRSTAADLAALGAAPGRLTVIEPAIDRAPLAQPAAKEPLPTLMFLGRLVRMKGVEDAIAALAALRRRLPACRLWIVGGGEPAYVVELRALAGRLGLASAVEFAGRVPEEEKYDRLSRAHLLLHPSQHEGWGINVIEANAVGTPAVAYAVPGLRDSIRDGVTGALCPPGRPATLAAAAAALLANPSRYATMQREALAWSRRFTWDAAAAQSLALFSRLTSGCPPPASSAAAAGSSGAPPRPRAGSARLSR